MKTTWFILFIGLFYAVGIFMLGYGLWAAWRSTAAGRWSTAPGTVTSCSLERKSDSDGGDTYEVKVAYAYAVNGRPYTGTRVAFGYGSSSGREAHRKIYDALHNAKGVEVRYDPSDPATSTLSYGVHRSIQFALAFAVTWLAFVVGFTLIWWLASRDDNVLLKNLVAH
jgi:hypothetical protein